MGMARLIRAEVACIELALLRVDARSRAGAFVGEQPHDRGVRGADAARQLQRVSLGVATLFRELILIERRECRVVLLDAAPHALGEDLGRVGDVPDDLDRGPLAESGRAQTVSRGGADDPRERRGVIGEREGGVLVVGELIQRATP